MIILFIFLSLWIGLSIRYSAIVFLIVLLLILVIIFKKYKPKVALICLAISFIGFGLSYVNINHRNATSFEGFVIDSKENYFILNSKGEKLYSYSKEHPYEIGDYLKIKGSKSELSFTTIESQFDFQDYLNKKGVHYEIKAEEITVSFSNPIKLKKHRQKFLSHFSENSQGLISAILFSDGSGETVSNLDNLHLGRIINASGIFIYGYLHFFSFILSFFIKNKKLSFIPLVILLPYFIFTFPRFTIIRILAFEIFRYINKYFIKHKLNSLEIIGLTGIGFLLIDYHLGYQMSFIIGFSLPIMFHIVNNALINKKKLKKRIWEILLMYLAFIPFELKFYNGIFPLSISLNIVLSPIFIIYAVVSLLCFYGMPLYKVIDFFSNMISKVFSFSGKFSFQINAPPLDEWWILIYALLLIVVLYYQSIQFIPLYRFGYVLLGTAILLYLLPIKNGVSEEVCFINVGQGDSCLIRKKNTTVLIDTGGLSYLDVANQSLIPFLKKKRIYNIDLVITTHNDYDHNGALDSLRENYYVKNVVTSYTSFPITIGGITFTNYNNHITSSNDDNDNSLVVGFHLCNKDFLIMGDATKENERFIINEYDNVPCDVLKVGHHGSNTSTSEEFVQYLSPEDAIISCGKNNRYGHPKAEVLEVLKRNNVNIYRTDLMGTISYFNYIFM